MKKVIYTIIIYSFLQLLFFMCLLIFDSDKKQKFNKAPEGFAIMLFDETKNDYTEVEGIPIGFYELNSDKSYCTNGGNITSYDRKTGKLNYSINGSDKCVIYLDILPDREDPVISVTSEYNKTITINFTDDFNLAGYAVTSENVSPGSWIDISGTNVNITYEASNLGEYYLWVKDGVGNVVSNQITIGQKVTLAGYWSYSGNSLDQMFNWFKGYCGYSMQEGATAFTYKNYQYEILNLSNTIYFAKNSYVGNMVQTTYVPQYMYLCTSLNCDNNNYSVAINFNYYGGTWHFLPNDITHFYLYLDDDLSNW